MRYAVVGGGIIGAAVARRLVEQDSDAQVTLLEKEDSVAQHQTGRNSGVIHAGLYYLPGSLKATLCRRGAFLLRAFCDEQEIAYRECGKVLVALDAEEASRLQGIAARAEANGVPWLRHLNAEGLRELEPHVVGVAGLHSPTTAIVDFAAVTRALASDARARGATVRTGAHVTAVRQSKAEVVLTAAAEEAAYDRVILCAGLQSDRVAALAGDPLAPRIVPFRGEYLTLREDRRYLARGLIYPVPDPRYPFLGVHLTPRIDGEVLIGPNAVLSLARERYGRFAISLPDLADTLAYPGFRHFARQHWRTGVTEMRGSFSRRVFLAAARRYVPELRAEDVVPGPTGIRAQAVDPDGSLVDDFRVSRRGNILAVRNAPSPAATSALAIAEHIISLLTSGADARPSGR